uniref:Uncharacterized protein n=1 Tax=Glossina brevipalpis TaxID=37001 RepID=A0A1A9WPJ7_9MUSC
MRSRNAAKPLFTCLTRLRSRALRRATACGKGKPFRPGVPGGFIVTIPFEPNFAKAKEFSLADFLTAFKAAFSSLVNLAFFAVLGLNFSTGLLWFRITLVSSKLLLCTFTFKLIAPNALFTEPIIPKSLILRTIVFGLGFDSLDDKLLLLSLNTFCTIILLKVLLRELLALIIVLDICWPFLLTFMIKPGVN